MLSTERSWSASCLRRSLPFFGEECLREGGESAWGDLERAEAVARDVLALRRQVQGDDHPDTASALRSVGIVLEDRGQTEEAALLIREALAIQRRVLPRPHRNTIDTIKLLARFVSPAEAVLLLRDAVEQVEMLYPPDHPSIAGARRALAEAEARVR